ncbi:MAG TPA: hypothetical protein VGM91_13665 [Conexibacter sp.]|jgi:hypothetical protein
MKTRSCIALLACLASLALSGVAQAAPSERPAAPSAPVSLVPGATKAAPNAPTAHTAAIGTDIAGAFAGKLATAGASYLIGQLQTGALGGTGKTIGDFLSKAGLGDPNAAVLAEFRAVNERLDALKEDVAELGGKIDALASAHANGVYSTHIALANPLRSAVLTGAELLERIARAPIAERPELAEEFVAFYDRRLANHEREFENYLTGGGVHGADGILQLASKRSFAAAQPFFTTQMSDFPRTVWHDYTMLQATWLQLQLNVMVYRGASAERVREAIGAAEGRINREWATIPSLTVFPNTVIDTRTNLMWSWKIDATPCSHLDTTKTYRDFNLCIYSHGQDASRAPYRVQYGYTSLWATNGSPPSGWKHPTVAQLQGLVHGQQGGAGHWLHTRGGFPGALGNETWTSQTSGASATTFNLSNGATASRAMTDSHYWMGVGEVLAHWYWLK